MFKMTQIKTIAAAAASVAAMVAPTVANAEAYALSHLQINNLSLQISNADVTIDNYRFNLTNNSTLNGVNAIETAVCGTGSGTPACSVNSPVLDAQPASLGTPSRANNNFSFAGMTGTSYSNADSVIRNAELIQFGSPTNTEQIAESNLSSAGNAAAGARIQSNTTVTIGFSIAAPGPATLSLSFLADPDLRAQLTQPFGLDAQADISATFLIRQANTSNTITFAPRGDAANSCQVVGFGGAVTCIEVADSEDLNTNVSVGKNPDLADWSYDTNAVLNPFGINIFGLGTGSYTITLASNTSTAVTAAQVVPEPASLALMGLAMFGIGAVSRRRRS